jgi:FkbM family methyltransferase
MKTELAKLANRLYDHTPALHRATYSVYKRWSDRAERKLLSGLILPGMTVLDVGANIGIYTEFLAKCVGPSGRVVAFEPEQRNLERLRTATRKYKQVEVVCAAVSDRSGTLKLYVADDLNVDHRSYATADARNSVDVVAVALDDFFTTHDQIDVIKMDIQGAELAAIRGARRLLASNRPPVILFECWPYGLRSAGETPQALFAELISYGYELRTIEGLPVPQFSSAGIDVYLNLVARSPRTNQQLRG